MKLWKVVACYIIMIMKNQKIKRKSEKIKTFEYWLLIQSNHYAEQWDMAPLHLH